LLRETQLNEITATRQFDLNRPTVIQRIEIATSLAKLRKRNDQLAASAS
jgi:hypothetical protein